MSIINTFDNETPALINPNVLAAKKPGFPDTAIVCFGEHFIDALDELCGMEMLDVMIACVNVPVYKFTYEEKVFAAYCSTLGGPATVQLMELMAEKGCKRFIFFGSCGVLDNNIPPLKLILPTEAYRDEGTSYHYAPPSDYITVKNAGRLDEIMTELEIPHVSGKTWTTDALFRETAGNTAKRKADGCIAVDMECASVTAAADFRGTQTYYILYSADSLDSDEWDSRTLGKLRQENRTDFMRTLLEIAAKI
ncbi:MAG: nucleoside phosphorylase [Ruminococcus sp.]|jgi:uridine phosphorylase|nr:nucleoside phosphorylase [Ruminococcus sp.]